MGYERCLCVFAVESCWTPDSGRSGRIASRKSLCTLHFFAVQSGWTLDPGRWTLAGIVAAPMIADRPGSARGIFDEWRAEEVMKEMPTHHAARSTLNVEL